MKTLFVALRHDYGDSARGPSFEVETFLPILVRLSTHVVQFDLMDPRWRRDPGAASRKLWDTVVSEDPDFLFCVLYRDELTQDVLRRIRSRASPISLNWFCDDQWRFDNFSRHWAQCFDWVATTDETAYQRYRTIGGVNPLLTQWAVNPETHHPLGLLRDIPITFLGQRFRERTRAVKLLEEAGIPVTTRGRGWPEGRVTREAMVDLLSRSQASLSFAEGGPRTKWRVVPRRGVPQIKARPFEIAASGALLLAEAAPGLEAHFEPGREAVFFNDDSSLVSGAREALADEERLRSIAQAGLERCLKEHTYANRFRLLFEAMGMDWTPT